MAASLSADARRRLDACQALVDYRFQDDRLLCEALTHASGAETRVCSNERLEFLGDAILGMIVCEELYDRFPKLLEGELTRIKSTVVSRDTCARISKAMNLGELLFLGKGMSTQTTLPSSLLADVFESLVAAIYLDGGMACAKQFIATHVFPFIDESACITSDENYKSQLQHVAQRDHGRTPTYAVLEEEGPDHSKNFLIAARLGDRQFEGAWGVSKKQAEQLAAKNALSELGRLNH